MNKQEIKVEGLDVAIAKLSIKSGDLIVLWNVTPCHLMEFRKKLLDHLPLDVSVPGLVSLYDDQSISSVNIKPGDTVVLQGEVGEAQFQRFKEQLAEKYQVSALQVPDGIQVIVERPCPSCGMKMRGGTGCGACYPFP